MSTRAQLSSFLAENNVKVLELFRDWDADGNGALDKRELRRAIKALGYYASSHDIDELFAQVDFSGDGQIDFKEMKYALNCFLRGEKPKPQPPQRMTR